jgi:cobalt-zinc-cadmium efflux system protein
MDCNQHSHQGKLWILLAMTSTYMLAEIVGGLLSGSLTLLADAGHMAIDSAAIALSLFATWIADKECHHEETGKYHRTENWAALINGVGLMFVALWIFYEAWERLYTPRPIQGQVMMWVASGGLVVNIIGVYLLHSSSEKSLNVRSVRMHLFTDLLGSISAMVAGILVWRLGWLWADPAISFFIAVFIFTGALRFVRECMVALREA